jgi:hypothetical protein
MFTLCGLVLIFGNRYNAEHRQHGQKWQQNQLDGKVEDVQVDNEVQDNSKLEII